MHINKCKQQFKITHYWLSRNEHIHGKINCNWLHRDNITLHRLFYIIFSPSNALPQTDTLRKIGWQVQNKIDMWIRGHKMQ